jgi:hypothetical protein
VLWQAFLSQPGLLALRDVQRTTAGWVVKGGRLPALTLSGVMSAQAGGAIRPASLADCRCYAAHQSTCDGFSLLADAIGTHVRGMQRGLYPVLIFFAYTLQTEKEM